MHQFCDLAGCIETTAGLNEREEEIEGAIGGKEGEKLFRACQSHHMGQSSWEGGRGGGRGEGKRWKG